MSTRVSYLNATNTYWQDIDLKNIERDFFTNGVADFTNSAASPSAVGDDLRVDPQVAPDKTVKVKAGVAYFKVIRTQDADGDGQSDEFILRFQSFDDTDLTIPDNNSGSDKTYEICCSVPAANMNPEDINEVASNVGELIAQEQGTGLDNKYLLATVVVEDGFTEVTAAKITDERARVELKAVPQGMLATIAEINLALEGILASAANLNILEGTTVTKEEFNRALTGLLTSAAELNLLDDVVGLIKSDFEKLANIDASADEIDQALDGISANVNAANLNILMGGGFTNLHKHASDPTQSGITDSPSYFYLPSDEMEAVAEKGIMTRFFYEEDAVAEASQNIQVISDDFDGYEEFYKVITNFEGEAGETYTGGSFDTVEYKEGTQARKRTLSLDSTGTVLVDFLATKDLSAFAGTDTIEFWVYVTTQANVDLANIQLGSSTPSSNYFLYDFLSQITGDGWNKIEIPINAFTSNGLPSWNDIVRVRIEYSTNTNGGCDFTADSLRAVASENTTGGMWTEEDGDWEMHNVGGTKRYVQTDETANDRESPLSLGTQSRNYLNGIVTARLRRLQGNGKTGVKFRYNGETDCYLAYLEPTQIVLAKNTGSETTIASLAEAFALNTDYWIKVQFNGTSIIVSVSTDGVIFNEKINTTDGDISGAGQIVIFDNGNISAFDDVIVEQTSVTYERETADRLVKIEENTGDGDNFDGYNSYSKKIATFELEENTMTGGVADTVNFKTGSQGWKITASGTPAYDAALDLNLTEFEDGINSASTDLIAFWVFIANEVPSELHLKLSEVEGSKEAEISINAGLSLGWNYVEYAKSAFTISGGFDWTKVTQARFWYVNGNNNPDVTFDTLQLIKSTGEVVANRYEANGGQWMIEKDIDENNQYLVQSDENSGEKLLLRITDGTTNKYTNFTYRGKFSARRGNANGLVFKYQDANNYLRLQCKNGMISFVRKLSGNDQIFGEEMTFTPTADTFYHLKAECDDNSFKYYYSEDGVIWVLIDEVSVADFTNGQIGIYSEGMLLRVDGLYCYEHNEGGDTFYQITYNDDGNVSSIIKKPII